MPNFTNYKPEDVSDSMKKYLGMPSETAQDEGTSEGAKKGWEKRKSGMVMPKDALPVGNTMKTALGKEKILGRGMYADGSPAYYLGTQWVDGSGKTNLNYTHVEHSDGNVYDRPTFEEMINNYFASQGK